MRGTSVETCQPASASVARNTIRFDAFWAGKVMGLPDINSCSLANATRLPVSVTRTDDQAELHHDAGRRRDVGAGLECPEELGRADDHRGAAAEAVEQRHHLRHRRHLHGIGLPRPQRGAHHHARDDHPVGHDGVIDQRDQDRNHHADAGDHVALPRGGGAAETLEADDEEDGGDQVENLVQPAGHQCFSSGLDLNMPSIRSVTA